MREAFAIFEGGGAKGLAHAGALKATEDNEFDLDFVGIAGTSAGAIVASLVACGCKADDIFEPDSKSGILAQDLTTLLDKRIWARLKHVRDQLEPEAAAVWRKKVNEKILWPLQLISLIAVGYFVYQKSYWTACIVLVLVGLSFIKYCRKPFRWILDFVYFYSGTRLFFNLLYAAPLIVPLVRHHGLLPLDNFEKWLNDQMVDALKDNPEFVARGDSVVRFCDVRPLKIIAADFRKQRIRVFEKGVDDNLSVAAAVCASISIPIIFQPKFIEEVGYIDGGVMSNFPAWVFDEEREEASPLTPTVGFRLVAAQSEQQSKPSFLGNLIDMFQSAVFGDNQLETRNVDTLRELQLSVDLKMLDFDAEPSEKAAVYNQAFKHARKWLKDKPIRESDEMVTTALAAVESQFESRVSKAIGKIKSRGDDYGDTHLEELSHIRIAVLLPTERGLRMIYTRGFDEEDDADDKMIFQIGQGACGCCIQQLEAIACDLSDKRGSGAKYGLDKYQRRLVRENLESLLCVPIFSSQPKQGVMGILSFDSDHKLFSVFEELADEYNTSMSKGEIHELHTCTTLVSVLL